jgi:hypothetical protein
MKFEYLVMVALGSMHEGGVNGQTEVNGLLHLSGEWDVVFLTVRLYVPFLFRKIDPNLCILGAKRARSIGLWMVG